MKKRIGFCRKSINSAVLPLIKKHTKGRTLEIGIQNKYVQTEEYCTEYTTLDIEPKHNPDIIADITTYKSEVRYDTIIITELLEHVSEPQQAVNNIHSLLKGGGKIIGSVPFIHSVHGAPKDYYRFTESGLRHLLREYEDIQVVSHGNIYKTIYYLIKRGKICFFLKYLDNTIMKINKKDSFPLGFAFVATKKMR